MTSPVNGTIKKLHAQTVGGVVKPGVDLIEVVPLTEKLIVEARLPVEDIGFVSIGQPVLLRLSGAHSQYFAPIPGRVKIISPDSEKSELGDVFYIVQIGFNQQNSHLITRGFCFIRAWHWTVLSSLEREVCLRIL